jgi:nitrogen regulatory protein PII
MKRIEAFILSEKTDSVLSTLEALNLQATFYGSKGMGKGEKYMVSYGRGAGSTKTSYSNRSTVVTIVEEPHVNRVVEAIKESAKTGKENAGIIVILTSCHGNRGRRRTYVPHEKADPPPGNEVPSRLVWPASCGPGAEPIRR